MRTALIGLVALTACTYPEKELAGRFACLGDPTSRANELLNIQGFVFESQSQLPFPGASIDLVDRNLSAIDTAKAPDANGLVSFRLPTVGVPTDRVYLHGVANGFVETFQSNTRPLTEDVLLPMGMSSFTVRDAIARGAFGPGVPFTPGTAAILMFVLDCDDKPVEDATLTSSPPGDIRYFEGQQPSMILRATDPGGVAMVANLPVQPITLTATVGDITYPPTTFQVRADAFTQTALAPDAIVTP